MNPDVTNPGGEDGDEKRKGPAEASPGSPTGQSSRLSDLEKMLNLKQGDWLEVCKEVDCLSSELAQSRAEAEDYREALKSISMLEKMELLCDPADWDHDAEDAYRGGSNNAFCQASEIAHDVLSKWKKVRDGS